jgi:hypothetical protein
MIDILKITIAAISLFFLSCSCGDDKDAVRRLEQARSLYDAEDFAAVKCLIDTINNHFPREIAVRKEALKLMRLTERAESERNIAFCDSLLPVLNIEFEKVKKNFVFEKDTTYDRTGKYIPPEKSIERNIERSYLRYGVYENGELFIASVYFGSNPINHTGLKLSLKDGSSATTAVVPYDGGLNYRFKDNGFTTEVVTFEGDKCRDAALFIVNAPPQEPLKAEYTGGKPFSLYLSQNDKATLKATSELASLLSKKEQLLKMKDKALKKIVLIDAKLNDADKQTATD